MKAFALCLFIFMLVPAAGQAYCFKEAGEAMKVDPLLLLAFAIQESHLNSNAIGVNKPDTKGSITYDYGLMQINSSHFSELERQGIDENQLINEPCTSIMVGASILSGMINVYGYNWEAVGAYNAGLKKENYPQRMRYAHKVWAKYQQIKLGK